jgi:putative glutamine amidotransferase
VRPRIGISAYWRGASWGPWTDMPACMVPQGYVEGVHAAGGVALLLPPDPDHASDDAASVLEILDGLILVGGEDIGPANYGAEPHASTDPANVRRDRAELALTRGAIARDLPVLGVCRGFQLLNIAYGGDLQQHVGDVTDGAPHRPRLGEFGRHDVDISGGQLREILGDRAAEIHSHHHQGIDRVGDGLVVTATAPDGLVEGIEDPSKAFCLGVLWHPEEDPLGAGLPLFTALIEQARAYRERATVQSR